MLLPLASFVLHVRRAFAWNVAVVPITNQEQASLASRGIASHTPQCYLAWRRSLLLIALIPLATSALLSTLDSSEELNYLNQIGWLITGVDLLAEYVLPVSALTAALLWTRPAWSRRVLAGGWVIGFLVPLLTGLVPLEWLLELPDTAWPGMKRALHSGIGVAAAVLYLFALMPTILSLLPGLLRACVRVKSLLPGSNLSGWFLVAGAPFYALLLFVFFIALNQAASSPLLLGGMGLLLTAPLVYAVRAPLFVRPLLGNAGRRSLARTQLSYLVCVTAGIVLLLAYLFTKKVAGIHLVGFDPDESLAQPWDLAHFAIEYLGRSLFITAVAADMLVMATLSSWRHERHFRDSADSDEHLHHMEELETAIDAIRKVDR